MCNLMDLSKFSFDIVFKQEWFLEIIILLFEYCFWKLLLHIKIPETTNYVLSIVRFDIVNEFRSKRVKSS